MGSERQDEERGPARWSRGLLGAAAVVAILGAATGRVVYSGNEEIAASTAALDAGDPREAIVRARRAAGWYAPGAPHVRVAYERLIALARAAEEHKRDDLALMAWQAIRTASIETRWLVAPHADDREMAEREIARLQAKVPGQVAPDARIAAEQLQKLRRHSPAQTPWVVALLAGLSMLAGGLVLIARQAADAGGRVVLDRAKLGLAIAAAGAGLWLLSLWQA